MREIIRAILASPVPVLMYVSPSGARAASAGTFMMYASHIAAMAPGTNTGAAHPVNLGGERRGADEGEPDPGIAKATEDAAALIRSLAAARGRSVEWAEKAVRQSLAYSADEALAHELVEVVARDRLELLETLDGTPIQRVDGRTQVLRSSDATLITIEPTWAERVLAVIADPQVAYLLLMFGFLGIVFELMSPGAIVPGVAGGISLLLAFYALSVLPVNWVGVLLILVGIALLMAEALVTSYGLLALAGIVSLVLGSLILVDTPVPAWRVGWDVILPSVAVLAAASLLLLSRALQVRRATAKTGLEAMIGEIGEVTQPIERGQAEGKIFVHGEYWTATADEPIPGGAKVRVKRIEGSRLRVAPADLVVT